MSAFLTGGTYGLVLHKRPLTYSRVAFAVFLITLVVDVALNTLWLSMLTGQAALVLLTPRLVKCVIMFPIQVICIKMVWNSLSAYEVLPESGHA